jgi:hypothetical protein
MNLLLRKIGCSNYPQSIWSICPPFIKKKRTKAGPTTKGLYQKKKHKLGPTTKGSFKLPLTVTSLRPVTKLGTLNSTEP